ncbi:hypothetical protein [Motiliproteus sp.]|uniref:hypothetical protein n=1 Tax=Motiliproteus sp. TaxID=1898955 RepID=UPI003BA8CA05
MTETAESKVRLEFDLHISHLTSTHVAFINDTSKVAGFLLLALGWYATSGDARDFLAVTPMMTNLAAVAIASAYLLSVCASWVAYRVSANAIRRLRELDYLPPSAYEGRVLGPITFAACVGGNGILAGLLIAALLIGS